MSGKVAEEINRDQSRGYIARDVLGEGSLYDKRGIQAERTRSGFAELLQGIPRMKELQWKVVDAQIQAREKMREVGFKRSTVSRADESFMKELQRLQAEGYLKEFEKLSMLADACQTARDGLGPLESEGAEAQREFEGQMWELRQAEDETFRMFASEFEETDEEASVISDSSSAHDILEIFTPVIGNSDRLRDQQNKAARHELTSIKSTQSGPERTRDISDNFIPRSKQSKEGSNVHNLGMLYSQNETHRQSIELIRFEHSVVSSSSIPGYNKEVLPSKNDIEEERHSSLLRHQDSLLLGVQCKEPVAHQNAHYEPTLSLDSEPIDHDDYTLRQSNTEFGSDSGAAVLDRDGNYDFTSALTKQHSSTESFPGLLTQFSTQRDRINKWLLHTMLISKSEANLIWLQLQQEPETSPSPWAELIVAYFEFDHNIKVTNSKTTENLDSREVKKRGATEINDAFKMPLSRDQEHQELPIHRDQKKTGSFYEAYSSEKDPEDIIRPHTIGTSIANISENPSFEAPLTIFSKESSNMRIHSSLGEEASYTLGANGNGKMNFRGYRKSNNESSGKKPDKTIPAYDVQLHHERKVGEI